VAGVEYWYVRMRNVETGAEVQRIAPAGVNGTGASQPEDAAEAMRAYLVRTGRANSDLHLWEPVEVHRFGVTRWTG
jgi:hypothetical protein